LKGEEERRERAASTSMIDLHCHILPSLDDGALSLDDSLAMARQAEEEGIAAVCATPHIRHDHDVRIEEIAVRADALQRELSDRGIAVRILTGGELAQTEADRLTDAELRAVTLGGAARGCCWSRRPGRSAMAWGRSWRGSPSADSGRSSRIPSATPEPTSSNAWRVSPAAGA
jgi:hypothetical protein